MPTASSTEQPTSLGRVLTVTSNFPRWQGDSTTPFVLHLAHDLQGLGWHVDVLAPHAPGSARREIIDGVTVDRFRYLWPARLQTVCYQGGALINLRKNPLNYLKLPALVLAELFALHGRLRRGHYDIVHCHWILPQGFVGALSARLLGIPLITTVHGGDIFALRGSVLRRLKAFALGKADAVTVNSSATRAAVMEVAPRLRKVLAIPMGVSEHREANPGRVQELRHRYGLKDGPLLVYVGRLVEEKGVEDLIRAVSAVSPELPNTTAMIVGEGQDRAALERLVQELGLQERIFFTGWVEPGEVVNYLAAGDMFVGPSRTSPEGWVEAQGLTFIESMLAGTPVIATRTGGIVDCVQHETTGLLVEERSPDKLAAAISRLASSPGLAENLAEAGAHLARSEFSRNLSAQRFSDLFLSLRKIHPRRILGAL